MHVKRSVEMEDDRLRPRGELVPGKEIEEVLKLTYPDGGQKRQ